MKIALKEPLIYSDPVGQVRYNGGGYDSNRATSSYPGAG
jgi:hypothetical protein